jgi:hypothetical protein
MMYRLMMVVFLVGHAWGAEVPDGGLLEVEIPCSGTKGSTRIVIKKTPSDNWLPPHSEITAWRKKTEEESEATLDDLNLDDSINTLEPPKSPLCKKDNPFKATLNITDATDERNWENTMKQNFCIGYFEYFDFIDLTINLNDKITEIKDKSFEDFPMKKKLVGFTMTGKNLRVIGENFLPEFNNLKKFELPDSVEEIKKNFLLFNEMTSFVAPKNLKSLSMGFLGGNNKIENLTLYSDIELIDSDAFLKTFNNTTGNLIIDFRGGRKVFGIKEGDKFDVPLKLPSGYNSDIKITYNNQVLFDGSGKDLDVSKHLELIKTDGLHINLANLRADSMPANLTIVNPNKKATFFSWGG